MTILHQGPTIGIDQGITHVVVQVLEDHDGHQGPGTGVKTVRTLLIDPQNLAVENEDGPAIWNRIHGHELNQVVILDRPLVDDSHLPLTHDPLLGYLVEHLWHTIEQPTIAYLLIFVNT